jgi:hypothetical protein
VADLTGNGIPDIVVTNYGSGDISVLLGNGDGTFQPQRRFNAVADPFDLAVGDLTGNGKQDIVVVSANSSAGTNLRQITVGALLGRGDGTFLPPKTFTVDLPPGDQYPLSSVKIADLNGDGIPDLILSGASDSDIRIFYGRGDGTFAVGPVLSGEQEGTALAVANFTGNITPDIIAASLGTGTAIAYQANGDGTFTNLQAFGNYYTFIGQGPIALAVGDVGSVSSTGSGLGAPDGYPDLVVANSGQQLGLLDVGAPGVSVLPSIYTDGAFSGFGSPVTVYSGTAPQDVAVGDFNNDGYQDIAVTDADGIHIIFGGTPTLVPNSTAQTALNLGAVTHVAEPTLSIVPGNEDAYFKLTAPTEADPAAGNEVLDFSGLFQNQVGSGLAMDLLNAAGRVIGSGDRFRVRVSQGEALTLHVHGVDANSAGAYTLDIDALPQVVSVQAQSLTPGANGQSAGPVSSLVVTLQGERLDPTAAQDSKNYQLIYLGVDGKATPQTIPLGSDLSVIYDPGANIDVSSGEVYPTAVKQTVTLLFDNPLPAGSYEIRFSSNIVSAAISPGEADSLAGIPSLGGHELVSYSDGSIIGGAGVVANDLVPASSNAQSLSASPPARPS